MVFARCLEILAKTHPQMDLEWRAEEARRRTARATGVQHRPPGLFGLALKAAFAYKVKGEPMEWKWSKASWKGLRAALGSALAIGAVATGEALLTAADTKEELLQLGAPALLVPILLGVGAVARNWLKQRRKAKGAEVYVTPPQG